MEYDVHTLLDLLTLVATVYVIFTMRRKLLRSYNARKDSVKIEYIVRPPRQLIWLAIFLNAKCTHSLPAAAHSWGAARCWRWWRTRPPSTGW